MLMRTDQLRDFDRLAQQLFGTAARPVAMPMDAYREGDRFIIRFDMPGTDRDSIDLTVEQNVLTVRAERPSGTFTRQLFLGETLDADDLSADYTAGVLTLSIPVRESAKPRKIEVMTNDRPALDVTPASN